MLNTLHKRDDKDKVVKQPLLDTFEFEWFFDVDGHDMKEKFNDTTYMSERNQYLTDLVARVMLEEGVECDIMYDQGSWSCFISIPSYYNTFLLGWAQYIGRAICKVFDIDFCRYQLDNNDREFEVHINHIVFADDR